MTDRNLTYGPANAVLADVCPGDKLVRLFPNGNVKNKVPHTVISVEDIVDQPGWLFVTTLNGRFCDKECALVIRKSE